MSPGLIQYSIQIASEAHIRCVAVILFLLAVAHLHALKAYHERLTNKEQLVSNILSKFVNLLNNL